ncbi:MAG: hypothetical protein EXQ88_01605 [Alphaproteobacteria bacterium]|nr:hypothetical protein [Alphaproteobacteria bacterium]
MPSNDRSKRLQLLKKMPAFAALDHRFFLDEHGKDTRLAGLSRNDRRRLKKEAQRIGNEYSRALKDIGNSGVGYPGDQLLRQLATEYTHRYAVSGIHTQPQNFNYFEPFCEIGFIERSIAPIAGLTPEVDHIFGIVDYFDYVTTPEGTNFDLSQLSALPEGKTYHFTPNGNISDFTFLSDEGREFVVGGFSMIRRGNSLHWYIVGGRNF